jgi:hypothetical protein
MGRTFLFEVLVYMWEEGMKERKIELSEDERGTLIGDSDNLHVEGLSRFIGPSTRTRIA